MKLLLACLFLISTIDVFSFSLDSIGIDTSAYLNSHEIEFLDSIFALQNNDSLDRETPWIKPELKEKKIVFVQGSSGKIVVTKIAFFDDLKKMEGEAINYMWLSDNEKKQSGGYDLIISNWSKYINKKKLMKTLSKRKIHH